VEAIEFSEIECPYERIRVSLAVGYAAWALPAGMIEDGAKVSQLAFRKLKKGTRPHGTDCPEGTVSSD